MSNILDPDQTGQNNSEIVHSDLESMYPETRIGVFFRPQGEYSDIFIHTQARVIFFWSKFEFQYFWGFSEK